MTDESTTPVPAERNPWKIFGIATIVVVVVGAAVGAGFVLGSSGDSSADSTPVATTNAPAPAPEPEPDATPAPVPEAATTTVADPEIDPEIERLLVAAEDGIPLIVSDFRWQNPELYTALKNAASELAPSLAEGSDCAVLVSPVRADYDTAKRALAANSAAAGAKIDALADDVAAFRRMGGELGDRAFDIHNILRVNANNEIGRINADRIDQSASRVGRHLTFAELTCRDFGQMPPPLEI